MGTGIRPVSVAERRARLAVRHRLAPRASTGADQAAIEHALYAEGTLVRMLGMRRTVFVVPVGLMPVVQAACTDQIAERMRRDLARRVEESGIAADGAGWLKEVGEATVRALAARGSATG